MTKGKYPHQGKGRRFRADLWLDEKITGRTLDALHRRGVQFPAHINPRKTQTFKDEYQRQLASYRAARADQKAAQKAPSAPAPEAGE